jgi:hypothetical protein
MGISLFFFDIVYTAIASALYVMPYEMAVTNKARSPIFIWKIVFSLFSTGIPMFFNSLISKILAQGYPTFLWIMVGVGLLGGIVIFLSTYFYKENGYVKDEPQPPFWQGLLTCLKNKSFLLFEAISFTVMYAQSSLMSGLAGVWQMWNSSYIGDMSMYVCYGAMLVGAAGALLAFVYTREKWGAKNLTLFMCAAFSFGCFLGSFLGRYFAALVVAFFFIGVGFAGGMYLIPIINGDVIDKDELDAWFAPGRDLCGRQFAHHQTLHVDRPGHLYGDPRRAFSVSPIPRKMGKASRFTIGRANCRMTVKNGFFIAWFFISGDSAWCSPPWRCISSRSTASKWNDEKAALAKKHADKEACL